MKSSICLLFLLVTLCSFSSALGTTLHVVGGTWPWTDATYYSFQADMPAGATVKDLLEAAKRQTQQFSYTTNPLGGIYSVGSVVQSDKCGMYLDMYQLDNAPSMTNPPTNGDPAPTIGTALRKPHIVIHIHIKITIRW